MYESVVSGSFSDPRAMYGRSARTLEGMMGHS